MKNLKLIKQFVFVCALFFVVGHLFSTKTPFSVTPGYEAVGEGSYNVRSAGFVEEYLQTKPFEHQFVVPTSGGKKKTKASFEINQDATVYLGTQNLPNFAADWVKSSITFETTTGDATATYELYYKEFPAGTVDLGFKKARRDSNYIVFVVPSGEEDYNSDGDDDGSDDGDGDGDDDGSDDGDDDGSDDGDGDGDDDGSDDGDGDGDDDGSDDGDGDGDDDGSDDGDDDGSDDGDGDGDDDGSDDGDGDGDDDGSDDGDGDGDDDGSDDGDDDGSDDGDGDGDDDGSDDDFVCDVSAIDDSFIMKAGQTSSIGNVIANDIISKNRPKGYGLKVKLLDTAHGAEVKGDGSFFLKNAPKAPDTIQISYVLTCGCTCNENSFVSDTATITVVVKKSNKRPKPCNCNSVLAAPKQKAPAGASGTESQWLIDTYPGCFVCKNTKAGVCQEAQCSNGVRHKGPTNNGSAVKRRR